MKFDSSITADIHFHAARNSLKLRDSIGPPYREFFDAEKIHSVQVVVSRIAAYSADDYLTDESYQQLQRALMENPERGDVMSGTGGFRKVRWEDARRGKGKRGGLRVIYYYHQIWFFTLYDKDEATVHCAVGCSVTLK